MVRVIFCVTIAIIICGHFSEINAVKISDKAKKQMYKIAQNGPYTQVTASRGSYLRRIPTYCWINGQWVFSGDSWQNLGKAPTASRTYYLDKKNRFIPINGRTIECYIVKSKNKSSGGKKKGSNNNNKGGKKQQKGQTKNTKNQKSTKKNKGKGAKG